MRLVDRLAISHGGTVSILEFQSERFLVATSPKGQISVLALEGGKAVWPESGCPISRGNTRETSGGTSRGPNKDKRKRTSRQAVQS